MHAGNARDALQAALTHALINALPEPGERPLDERQVDVRLFPQLWGGTALGFGGLTCHAMTTAYTVVVIQHDRQRAAVYFNGRFAYRVDLSRAAHKEAFFADVALAQPASVREAVERYGAATALPA